MTHLRRIEIEAAHGYVEHVLKGIMEGHSTFTEEETGAVPDALRSVLQKVHELKESALR